MMIPKARYLDSPANMTPECWAKIYSHRSPAILIIKSRSQTQCLEGVRLEQGEGVSELRMTQACSLLISGSWAAISWSLYKTSFRMNALLIS